MAWKNHPQFSDKIHASRAHVWTKAGDARRGDGQILGSDAIGERDESRRDFGNTIKQLEIRPEDLELLLEKIEVARLKNKDRFDKTHQLRPKNIEERDWIVRQQPR